MSTASSTPIPTAGNAQEIFRLSDLLKRPVLLGSEKIGSLSDLVIVDKDVVAEVSHVCVHRPFGRACLYVPWLAVAQFGTDGVVIDVQAARQAAGVSGDSTATNAVAAIEAAFSHPPAANVLLQDYIVDKKVLDVEGREVEVVYDVTLALQDKKLYVFGVDLSRRSLLRRIGLKWLANLTASITDSLEKEIVAWDLVEPLPEGIGSFAGDIKLKVLKEQLGKMPPVDIARILEQLNHATRVAVIDSMETAVASDALEELDPKAQRELVAEMPKEKAAELIDAMTPGQAADVVGVLSHSQRQEILTLIDTAKAKQVHEILTAQEGQAADFVSIDFVKLRPETTVAQARQSLQSAQEREAVAYLYVLDENEALLGVVNTTDLLTSGDAVLMSQIMIGNPVSLEIGNTLKEAEEMFERYGYRALPVIDDAGKMQGIVPYRDVMDLKH